ncbi:MAG TPA: ATP-grasp domain-containing protein [Oligoflexia bacterium]|nr:ATP-grasp domain-containing protein [Oligoflexia bacterium]HMP48363.1 ATP-grasp domain-containing protein [Oligoflexia bacterium]
MKNKKVLVLDGETRSSLAVVRSLGKEGYSILVASSMRDGRSLAGSSKYAFQSIKCPCSLVSPDECRNWVLDFLRSENIYALIVTKDSSLQALASDYDKIKELTIFPFVDSQTLFKVQDKSQLLKVAEGFGIPVPRTAELESNMFVDSDCADSEGKFKTGDYSSFPSILKPGQSVQIINKNKTQLNLPRKLVSSWLDVRDFFKPLSSFYCRYLLQEVISGEGVGIFCLYREGKCVLDFSHRRILEKPPEGGVSVLSESIPLPQELMEKVHKLLSHYNWDGVAMVEFKRHYDGKLYLMEINPRFWGSLQLAIDCGCNFPRELLKVKDSLSETGLPDSGLGKSTYEVGKKLRWELGTFDHFLIQLKRGGFRYLKQVFFENALFLFSKNTCFEVFRINDFSPFIYELRSYFVDLFRAEGK